MKKYWSIDVGTGVFLLNMLVIAASAVLFDLETAHHLNASAHAENSVSGLRNESAYAPHAWARLGP